MKIAKAVIVLIGLIIVVSGGWIAWRNAHPALSDAQQLQANLQSISAAAARHSANGIMNYLADGFTWNGQNRHDLASMLTGAMFEYDTVNIETSGVIVQVRGATAVTTGNYTLTVRQQKNQAPQTYQGKFRVEWEKQRGQWMATKADSEGSSPV